MLPVLESITGLLKTADKMCNIMKFSFSQFAQSNGWRNSPLGVQMRRGGDNV
jgi:hypothetical protein